MFEFLWKYPYSVKVSMDKIFPPQASTRITPALMASHHWSRHWHGAFAWCRVLWRHVMHLVSMNKVQYSKFLWSTVWTCALLPGIISPLRPGDTMKWHRSGSTLVQAMACCLTSPSHCLNKPMLTYYWWGSVAITCEQFHRKCFGYQSAKWVWKLHFKNC